MSIQVSPFYLQIAATGIPATAPFASALGALTRILLILCSAALLGSSFRPTAWWRSLATWLALASLTELFFSLLLFVHTGQTALLTAYGANPPTSGTISYPARILGIDLNTYQSPSLTASFNLDFYLGLLSLTIVGASTILKMLQERGLISAAAVPGVKEFFLIPPYRHAWLSTGDRDLNPLSQDPENTTDDQLLESFGKIYRTVQPGGIITVILPSWASTLGDRFQKLLTWTGFSVEDTGTIYRAPGKPETQLRFKKPISPSESDVQEPEATPVLEQAIESESSFQDIPPQLTVSTQPDWGLTKMTKQERAMLRSALSILSKQREPMPYHELLNQVYMELVERKVEFDSARQIELTLLKHAGQEIALTEETDEQGLKSVKRWSLGTEDLSPDHQGNMSIFRRLSSRHPRVPPVMRLLRKWQRKPKYRPRSKREEE
ncbi:MAG: hypothetical protein AUF79_20100 [Crenarchaeota archaeon 13_1_20CM_2_51_8]|nr:MAG: hypothetical protein AUF79_20100 [Crenarchaeota archaeon 13_1_20CM_2_51_8]